MDEPVVRSLERYVGLDTEEILQTVMRNSILTWPALGNFHTMLSKERCGRGGLQEV